MNFNTLFDNIKSVHETLQASVSKAINISITIRNWFIGYFIVEFEQKGEDRAKYGEKLLIKLEDKFTSSRIKGMNERRYREYRQFYCTYPQIGQVIRDILPVETIRRLPIAEFEPAIKTVDIY